MMKQVQDPSVGDERKALLKTQMIDRAAECPVPEGALSLPKAVVRPPWWKA